MKRVNWIFLVVLVMILASCTGGKQLVTYWRGDLQPDALKITGYDFESKLRWTCSNDAEYLYFDISTADQAIQRNILMRGLTVYLDTAVRKKEYVYFRYPLNQMGGARAGNRQRNSRQASNPFDRGISQEFIEMVNLSPVYWQAGEVWKLEDPMAESATFKSGTSLDSGNTLKLHVGIPLTSLHPLGLNGLDRLSVGFSVPGGMAGPGQGGGQMMDAGGGSGGTAMGGGQMPGMTMGGPGSVGTSFWYVTTLAKQGIE